MGTFARAPSISVVIVCDHEAGREDGWNDIRQSLAALAAQDLNEPAEFIFCESDEFGANAPADLTDILPGLKILTVPRRTAYDLKNAGVEVASCELIAMIDADCVPRRDWLRRLLDSLRRHPQAAVISGRTTYPGKSLLVRISALLSRAYSDRGGEGRARFIADNNAGYRRSAYLAHPLPTNTGRFAAHIQAQELRCAGYRLWFDPAFEVEHGFEGWLMEKDIRRNRGYSTIQTRLINPSLPYGWLVRAGPIGIAPILAWKILGSWRDCVRCGRVYHVKWYELPVVMAAAVRFNLLEFSGMWAAFRRREFGKTCFR
jgi:hypothetical protein